MSYSDVWKKKMQSEIDTGDTTMSNSKKYINRKFKNDPSYRLAQLQDFTSIISNIDIRLENTDTENEEGFIFLPDTLIEKGSYITYKDKKTYKPKTYIIEEFQTNSISPFGKGKKCNQKGDDRHHGSSRWTRLK